MILSISKDTQKLFNTSYSNSWNFLYYIIIAERQWIHQNFFSPVKGLIHEHLTQKVKRKKGSYYRTSHSRKQVPFPKKKTRPKRTWKTKPTMVVPVLRNEGAFRPFSASMLFLLHKSKLNPPFGGPSIVSFDILNYKFLNKIWKTNTGADKPTLRPITKFNFINLNLGFLS